MCQRVAERGRYASAYSSISAGPQGTRGLYDLTERMGKNPVRWHRDLLDLPSGAMVVALSGCDGLSNRKVTDLEAELLHTFVSEGGTLLVGGAEGFLRSPLPLQLSRAVDQCAGNTGLLSKLKKADTGEEVQDTLSDLPAAFQADPKSIAEAIETDGLAPTKLVDSVSGSVAQGLGSLPMRQLAMIEHDDSVSPRRIYVIDGEAAAVELQIGKGHLLVFSSASMFQNRELASSDGGVLFARLVETYAKSGTVVFDEFHLGIGTQRSTMQYLRDMGLGALLIQIVVVLLFLLWRFGARFGTFRPRSENRAVGEAAFIDSMAGLYTKSGDHQSAAEVIRQEALMRVSAHHRLFGVSMALSRNSIDNLSLRKTLHDRNLLEAEGAVEKMLRLSIPEIKTQRHFVSFAKNVDKLTAIAIGADKGNP